MKSSTWKKIVSLGLVGMLSIGMLAGCGGGGGDNNGGGDSGSKSGGGDGGVKLTEPGDRKSVV